MNFMQMAHNIGDVLGLFGTMAAIADIFLYTPKVPIEGGDNLKEEALEQGSIKLENIQFTYPTKKEV